MKFVFCVCTTKYEHPHKKHKSTKMVIYENVNYDLIRTNNFPISLLISNHIGITLCSYSFFVNIHLVTFENLLWPVNQVYVYIIILEMNLKNII